jgi:hypothetical protein
MDADHVQSSWLAVRIEGKPTIPDASLLDNLLSPPSPNGETPKDRSRREQQERLDGLRWDIEQLLNRRSDRDLCDAPDERGGLLAEAQNCTGAKENDPNVKGLANKLKSILARWVPWLSVEDVQVVASLNQHSKAPSFKVKGQWCGCFPEIELPLLISFQHDDAPRMRWKE